jgi:hypothetical protein
LVAAITAEQAGTELLPENNTHYQARARSGWESDCKAGWDLACWALVEVLEPTGHPADIRRSAALRERLDAFWRESCETGNAIACFRGGSHFDRPEHLLQSCELGYAKGCVTAGARNELSPEEHLRLLSRGCELNHVASCEGAAHAATDPETRAVMTQRARALSDAKCERQNAHACGMSAKARVREGRVSPADEAEARAFKQKEVVLREAACTNESIDDCLVLADIYASAIQVDRDIVKAETFKQRACELGFQAACHARRDVLGDVVDASVGYHTCVVKGDGTVWCWGQNREGQLGDGTQIDRAQPVQVKEIHDAREVDVYGSTTCVRTQSDQAWCWGGGFKGIQRVDDNQRVLSIATGFEHACALRENGDVGCSGADPENFALGAQVVRASGLTHCAIASSKLLCWGSVMQDYVPEPKEIFAEGVADLSLTGEGMCVRFADGRVTCRAQPLKSQPLREVKLDGARLVGGDADAGCAMRGDELWCWYLRDGQLKKPFLVQPIEGVTKLVIASYEGCAVKNDGELLCWYVFNPEPEPVSFQLPAE